MEARSKGKNRLVGRETKAKLRQIKRERLTTFKVTYSKYLSSGAQLAAGSRSQCPMRTTFSASSRHLSNRIWFVKKKKTQLMCLLWSRVD